MKNTGQDPPKQPPGQCRIGSPRENSDLTRRKATPKGDPHFNEPACLIGR
ncbi:MAG: hypothetical protein ACYTFW_21730 [Planctomycetota bacterium]